MGNYANLLVMEADAYKRVAVLEKDTYLSPMHLETSSAFGEVSDGVAVIKGSLKTAP